MYNAFELCTRRRDESRNRDILVWQMFFFQSFIPCDRALFRKRHVCRVVVVLMLHDVNTIDVSSVLTAAGGFVFVGVWRCDLMWCVSDKDEIKLTSVYKHPCYLEM